MFWSNGVAIEVTTFIEKYGLDRKDYGWSIDLLTQIENALTTKREIAIVSSVIAMSKDRPGLKSRIQAERAKAKKDKVEHRLHNAILTLMARAEAGRALVVCCR